MKILKITLITLAVLVLAGWFLLFRSVPLKVSPETTILTEPLTEDGRWVDYRSYFISQFPKDGNTEKNSARGMVALFGSGDENFKPEHWKMLGLEPFDENRKAPFEIPEPLLLNEKFKSCEKNEDCLAADPEAVREFVTSVSPALDAMAEVIQNSEFYFFPIVSLKPDDFLFIVNVDIGQIDKIACAFELRALQREKDGDQEGADADRLTLLKFGRQIQNDGLTIASALTGKRVERMGAGLKDPEKWKTLEPIDREKILRQVLENERISVASTIQYLCRTGRNEDLLEVFLCAYDDSYGQFAQLLMQTKFDWNIVAKRLNETTQKLYFPDENAEPYEIPVHHFSREFPKILSRRARSEIMADFFVDLLISAIPPLRKIILEEVSAPATNPAESIERPTP